MSYSCSLDKEEAELSIEHAKACPKHCLLEAEGN